jgi:hypothetical protein
MQPKCVFLFSLPISHHSAIICVDCLDCVAAVHELLEKLDQVYMFMVLDQMLGRISSMRIILGQISQQTLEYAPFIKNYREIKDFCKAQQVAALCTVSSSHHYHREET